MSVVTPTAVRISCQKGSYIRTVVHHRHIAKMLMGLGVRRQLDNLIGLSMVEEKLRESARRVVRSSQPVSS